MSACPACNGTGELTERFPTKEDPSVMETGIAICDECDGTGTVCEFDGSVDDGRDFTPPYEP